MSKARIIPKDETPPVREHVFCGGGCSCTYGDVVAAGIVFRGKHRGRTHEKLWTWEEVFKRAIELGAEFDIIALRDGDKA
jgi:hypothetical protein